MSVRYLVLVAVATLPVFLVVGCDSNEPTQSRPKIAAEDVPEFSYDVYTELLQEFVDDTGMVDYAGLLARRGELDAFVASMSALDRAEFDTWTEEAQIAFWINVYNAVTLQYILDHYPIEKRSLVSGALYPANSIRQIPGVWDELTTPFFGEALTLDAVEHEILRKEFQEPRIHVAIVCASIGCPPLRNEAFVGERLDEQLADQSEIFFSDPSKLSIDENKNSVVLSPILKWFGEDFIPVYGDDDAIPGLDEKQNAIANYAATYASEEQAAYLREGGYTISYSDYDWSLNEQ